MDVHCTTCDEPWAGDYLRHEAIYDIGLSEEAAKAWRKLPSEQKLTQPLREQFHAAGWEFGNSILNVRHCPACPSEAEINDQKDAVKTALDDLLGEDEDGLLAMYEDFGL